MDERLQHPRSGLSDYSRTRKPHDGGRARPLGADRFQVDRGKALPRYPFRIGGLPSIASFL
jgi:hypothetical protein